MTVEHRLIRHASPPLDEQSADNLARDLGSIHLHSATLYAYLASCIQQGATEREALIMMVRELVKECESRKKCFEEHLAFCVNTVRK